MAADIEVVIDAIRTAALCVICLARKVGAAPFSVISALTWIGQRMKLTNQVTRCDACLQETVVYRIR